jgi:plasmid stabilization system protein ParE
VQVDLHPDARAELRAAALWHDERQDGLGDRFLERIHEALRRILEMPAAYPVWPGTEEAVRPIRRALVEQFPYAVAFEGRDDQLLVLAVTHTKRRPLYWLARSTSHNGRT